MTSTEPRVRPQPSRTAFLRQYAIVPAFLVLFAVVAIASPHFLTRINLLNTVESGSIYGIVAIGLTLLLIAGEFDLCAGATYVFAGIVAAKLQPSLGTVVGLAAGLLAGLAIGVFNGLVVAGLRVNSFVATLATSLMVVGLGTTITGGFQLYIADPSFAVLGNGTVIGVPIFVWIFALLAAAAGFVLQCTKLGRWVYATGGNREAARLSGVSVGLLTLGAFAFSGFSAGLAGIILVSRTATAIAGNGLAEVLLPAVAAVVVGGTSILGGRGAIWRTVIGVLFLEVMRNGFNLLEVDAYYQDIIAGGIILLAVSVDTLSRR